MILKGILLQVENDIGSVFHHARDPAEFVFDTFKAHSRNRRAFNRAQQHTA